MKLKTLMQALREAARQAGHSNPEVILCSYDCSVHLGNGGDDGDIFHEINVTCGCDAVEGGGYTEITIQPRHAVAKRREMLKAQISSAQTKIMEAKEDLASLQGDGCE